MRGRVPTCCRTIVTWRVRFCAVADGGAYFSPEVANLLREGYLEGSRCPVMQCSAA
jgi:hypothetical protein